MTSLIHTEGNNRGVRKLLMCSEPNRLAGEIRRTDVDQ
jgi:hypothetical protein